jgi:hypothetical protein
VRSIVPLALALAGVGCAANESIDPVTPAGDPPYVPPPESCDGPDLDHPGTFRACNVGSGVFGTWVIDDLGRPAYDYGLDQNADERAAFFNTEGIDRRDHWHAIGNERLNVLVYNEGYVEVVTQDRGVSYLNKFEPEQNNFAGGFSYLDDGAEVWCSAYAFRPKGSRTTRRFGMGYADASTEYRGVRLSRRLVAPAGAAAVLVDEVTIENTTSSTKSLAHYEVWDVARRPVDINWTVSGDPIAAYPDLARRKRDAQNARFDERVTFARGAKTLGLRREHARGVQARPPSQPSPHDDYPGDPFLAALEGDVHDVYTEQDAFFGDGGPRAPAAVTKRKRGHGVAGGPVGTAGSGEGQPRMLAMRSDVTLEAGEKRVLRFAFGYAPMGQPYPPVSGLREVDHRAAAAAALDEHTLVFASSEAPALHRELAWHASQIEASVGRRDYWDVRVVPQGSAYLYLHGADGAARDLSLFAVPLSYTNPALAKEVLSLNMMITHADDRRISYAFQGHGMLDDALGLHVGPSDLPIFLLWGLSEYVGATGDVAFLDAPMPYHPRGALPDATVLDHVRDAVRYLFDEIGTGEHGLLRITTGDWSDGIVLEAPDMDKAIAEGESVPNTQMAVATLPRVADLLEAREPELAAEIRGRVAELRAALAVTWTGRFFGARVRRQGEPGVAGVGPHRRDVRPARRSREAPRGDPERARRPFALRRDAPAERPGVAGDQWAPHVGLRRERSRPRAAPPGEEHDGLARHGVPRGLVRHLERARRVERCRHGEAGRVLVLGRHADGRLPRHEQQPARDAAPGRHPRGGRDRHGRGPPRRAGRVLGLRAEDRARRGAQARRHDLGRIPVRRRSGSKARGARAEGHGDRERRGERRRGGGRGGRDRADARCARR